MLLLEAIAEVESNNRVAVGDHGAALSKYQIHRAVWQDVKIRFGQDKAKCDVGREFGDIGGSDFNSQVRAFNTATGQVALIEEYLLKHGVGCTAENIYACWNLGREGFRRRNFHLDECPAATIRNAIVVANLSTVKQKSATETQRTQRK